jgi:hypothetical protein
MVCKGDRIFGCNSFDDAKETISGEVEFIFSALKEIAEENLLPIKKIFAEKTKPDMAIDWKKAESERTENLRAWRKKRAEQKRERQFKLEQIRNARPASQSCEEEDRESSGDYQGSLNEMDCEMFDPPLCENERDRELLDAQDPRKKGQSSNTNRGRDESSLARPGHYRGESPMRTQSTKKMGRPYGDDGDRDMSAPPPNGHGHSRKQTLSPPSNDPDGQISWDDHTVSIPEVDAFDCTVISLDDVVPEKAPKARDSFEVIDTSHWQKAGRKTAAGSRNAIDDASYWTEVRNNRKDLSDASFWLDVRSKKTTATRISIEEVATQFGKELRGEKCLRPDDSIAEVAAQLVKELRGEKCLRPDDSIAEVATQFGKEPPGVKGLRPDDSIAEVATQFGKEPRGVKGLRPDDSIGKVDTTFWEKRIRGEKGDKIRDATLEEIDRRAWHIFK